MLAKTRRSLRRSPDTPSATDPEPPAPRDTLEAPTPRRTPTSAFCRSFEIRLSQRQERSCTRKRAPLPLAHRAGHRPALGKPGQPGRPQRDSARTAVVTRRLTRGALLKADPSFPSAPLPLRPLGDLRLLGQSTGVPSIRAGTARPRTVALTPAPTARAENQRGEPPGERSGAARTRRCGASAARFSIDAGSRRQRVAGSACTV